MNLEPPPSPADGEEEEWVEAAAHVRRRGEITRGRGGAKWGCKGGFEGGGGRRKRAAMSTALGRWMPPNPWKVKEERRNKRKEEGIFVSQGKRNLIERTATAYKTLIFNRRCSSHASNKFKRLWSLSYYSRVGKQLKKKKKLPLCYQGKK